MILGHFESFQITTAYYTKLKLALRHAKEMDGWIGLDRVYKFGCCTKIWALKYEPCFMSVAKWMAAPV